MKLFAYYTFFFLSLIGLFNSTSLTAQNSPELVSYVCPPCPYDCHDRVWSAPGKCPVCKMDLVHEDSLINVAVFLYDGVEVLDFSGPGEVFAASKKFHVYTVAATQEPLISQGFVKINPTFSIENCPKPDIIVLPGGSTRSSINNPKVIEWVQQNSGKDHYLLSLCTGAFILEKAGLLDGKQATTWYGAIKNLKRKAGDRFEVLENTRWVDNGNIITTAGVSAGIDGALHLVKKLCGDERAQATAEYMEYDKWNPEEGKIVEERE